MPDSEPHTSANSGDEREFTAAHHLTAERVVEIAVSSATLDREKAPLYAQAGMKEYWIALAPERRVEVYRRPQEGRCRKTHVFRSGDMIECISLLGIRLSSVRLSTPRNLWSWRNR